MNPSPKVLRPLQRRLLLAHIDGPRSFNITHHRQTMDSLITAGLLVGVPEQSKYPTHTRLTIKGREEVSAILAEAAEALVAAGCLESEIVDRVRSRPIFLRAKPDAQTST